MDLNACLEILAGRGQCEHESTDNDHECPMGQVIDLLPSPEEGSASTPPSTMTGAGQTGTAASHLSPAEQQQQTSVDKFREEMRSMEAKDLISVFIKAQEERVATYRMFDEGLETMLSSSEGGMEGYSGVCAEATASFAALSNLVNAVESLLRDPPVTDKSRTAAASLIRKVQLQEKEKFSVTAALHLERVRLRDAGGEHVLLKQGVVSLQDRLSRIKCSIMELLDEIKYETEEFFCE